MRLEELKQLDENVVIGGTRLSEIYDKIYNNLKIAKSLAEKIAKAIGHRIIVVQREEEKEYKVVPFELYDHWSRKQKQEWHRV